MTAPARPQPGFPQQSTLPDRPAVALYSVVLCTLGRNEGLREAVRSILGQEGINFELIVVDNDPGSGGTLRSIEGLADHRMRYVAESRRGLSRARNTGLGTAHGQVVVFTDDDCIADRDWLRAIHQVLATHPGVAAVTGRTLPAGSPTPVQTLFEEFGSFNRGEALRVWRHSNSASAPLSAELTALGGAAHPPAIFPYSAVFGSGNNMAIRAEVLDQVGPFDEALGAGSPAGGGEDLDMFVRLMLAGQVLVYEPDALVWHAHREDAETLAAQVGSYGSGLSGMITKHLLLDNASRVRIVKRAWPGVRHLLSSSSTKNARKSPAFPKHLTRTEMWGLARGPWLYLKGRRTVRRSAQQEVSGLQVDARTSVADRSVARS